MQVFFHRPIFDQEYRETGPGTLDPDLQYKLLPIGQTRKAYRYIRLSL